MNIQWETLGMKAMYTEEERSLGSGMGKAQEALLGSREHVTGAFKSDFAILVIIQQDIFINTRTHTRTHLWEPDEPSL